MHGRIQLRRLAGVVGAALVAVWVAAGGATAAGPEEIRLRIRLLSGIGNDNWDALNKMPTEDLKPYAADLKHRLTYGAANDINTAVAVMLARLGPAERQWVVQAAQKTFTDRVKGNEAYDELESLGPYAGGAVQPLIKVLQSKLPSDLEKLDAVRTLAAIGPAAKAAAPKLRQMARAVRRQQETWEQMLRNGAEIVIEMSGGRRISGQALVRAYAALADEIETAVTRVSGIHLDKRAEFWIGELASGDATAVKAAEEALRTMQLAAVPALAKTVSEGDPAGRIAAARALGALKRHAMEAVPALIEATRAADAEVRRQSLYALKAITEAVCKHRYLDEIDACVKPAVVAFTGLLNDPDRNIRRNAVGAIEEMGPLALTAAPALVEAIKAAGQGHEASDHRSALEKMGLAVVPGILPLADHEKADVRRAAAEALGAIAREHRSKTVGRLPADARLAQATEAVARLVKDADSGVRIYAGSALAEFGLEAVPAAVALVAEGNPEIRKEALDVLRKIAENHCRRIEQYEDRKKQLARRRELEIRFDRSRPSRDTGAGRTTPSRPSRGRDPVERAREQRLKERGEEERRAEQERAEEEAEKARRLKELARLDEMALGPAPQPDDARLADGLAAVVKATEDADDGVREKARGALQAFGLSAVAAAVKLLDDPDADVRESGARALRDILSAHRRGAAGQEQADPKLKQMMAALMKATGDADPRVRRVAAETLGRLRLGPEPIEGLLPLVSDPDLSVRREAVRSLGEIGLQWRWDGKDAQDDPLIRNALPVLAAAAGDAEPTVRLSVASALRSFGSGGVPTLVELLGDADANVRRAAAQALEWVKPKAVSAVDPLNKLAGDPDEDEKVRQAAAQAVKRITER